MDFRSKSLIERNKARENVSFGLVDVHYLWQGGSHAGLPRAQGHANHLLNLVSFEDGQRRTLSEQYTGLCSNICM